jgi:hypothetical protein
LVFGNEVDGVVGTSSAHRIWSWRYRSTALSTRSIYLCQWEWCYGSWFAISDKYIAHG